MIKVTLAIDPRVYEALAHEVAPILSESDCHPYDRRGKGLDLTGLIVIPQLRGVAHHAQLDLFVGPLNVVMFAPDTTDAH